MRLFLSIIAAAFLLCHGAVADNESGETSFSLPLVFDPIYKKYFIGANAKFLLKQGADASILDRIEVSIDGGTFKPYAAAITFDREGKHTIKFRARNAVNSFSPIQFAEVFVDLSPPTTEPKWSDRNSFREQDTQYLALGTHVTLNAQDNLSGVGRIEYSWDKSSFLPYQKPIPLEKPGKQRLYYRSVDRVGNMEPTREVAVVVDGTPPVTVMTLQGTAKHIEYEGKKYLGASDGTGFVLESNDELSRVKNVLVAIDGAATSPYLRPIFFLKDGPHVLKYWGVDNVGNAEEAKVINIYTVSQAPRTIATPSGKVVNNAGMNFAGRDFQLELEAKQNVVGLDRIEYKINEDEDFRTYVEPLRFKAQGQQTITYRSLDLAGNVEPARGYTVTISWDAPETTLITSVPLVNREGIDYSPSPNMVSFAVRNTTVGTEKTVFTVNELPEQSYKAPFPILNKQKVYKIVYRSVDRLGNEESPKTAQIHMITSTAGIDLFVSDGKTKEERLRTDFFDAAPVKRGREPAAREEVAATESVADDEPPTKDETPPGAPAENSPKVVKEKKPKEVKEKKESSDDTSFSSKKKKKKKKKSVFDE